MSLEIVLTVQFMILKGCECVYRSYSSYGSSYSRHSYSSYSSSGTSDIGGIIGGVLVGILVVVMLIVYAICKCCHLKCRFKRRVAETNNTVSYISGPNSHVPTQTMAPTQTWKYDDNIQQGFEKYPPPTSYEPLQVNPYGQPPQTGLVPPLVSFAQPSGSGIHSTSW